jgi:DNA helicase-2/ATP-dependent DNA helicase PcrA
MTEELEARFLSARRSVIAGRFSHLNPEQQTAVLTTEGPLLLLAGAGSGKTTVLINRIANLMQYGSGADSFEIPDYVTEDHVLLLESYLAEPTEELREPVDKLCAWQPAAPWNIIAITFTNKAANELKERLENILGEDARDVWAMTFHSACCRILRRYIDRLGYDSSFTIYDSSDSERVMKDVLKSMDLDEKSFQPKAILNQISRAKDKQLSPDALLRQANGEGDFRLEKIAQAYGEYQNRLKTANAVDFDDIILLTVQLLQQDEEVRDYYQRKFRYVLIDEYQDTNNLQYLLASLLAGRYENICVVGDDDQSIYRFRGATIENILSFESQYKGARVIRLEQNYRSTKHILEAANAVIANNRGRKGKKLWTDNATGDKIRIYEAFNEGDEANFVAAQIVGGVSKGGSFNEYAVLYRTNAQSNAMEYAFKRNGIPYRIIGGTRFFDRAEVKDMLAYLCLINNRTDDLRLRRIINNPPRGIGQKTVELAERQAECANLPLYQVVSDPYSYPCLQKATEKLMKFTVLIEECTELLETLELPDFYDELLRRTGYLAMLEEKDTVENRTRAENVKELKSSIISYVENTDEPSLNGFLEEIALYTDLEQYDQGASAVVMMTMHSAKGLEFPHVFLVGAEEGLFPSGRAMAEPEELEEERRLCYVAITRAKKSLAISYATQRMLYGRTTINRPSRFIAEIPDECVTGRESRTERRQQQRQSAYSQQRQEKKPSYGAFSGYSSPKPAMLQLNKGDMVQHKAFGKGMVLSVLPMGNDALLEIAFDNVGTKKLMAKSASVHMQKL